MKKQITTLLILFLTLGLYAETGYAGIEWGTAKNKFKFEEELEGAGIINKTMLGEETRVFYSFNNKNNLDGISYSISRKKTSQLINRYPYEKRIGSIKIDTLTKEDLYKDLGELAENEKLLEEYISIVLCSNAAPLCDVRMGQGKRGYGDCTVHIYNYNDDTRVYIFENLVEGRTFVYYTFHEQDY